MGKIKFKETPKYTKEVIGEVLKVKEEKGLTAENLLDNAKNKKSSLHNFFDWDNDSAGEKFRLHQARMIINEIKFYVEDKEMYAFEIVTFDVQNSNKTEFSKEYKTIPEILSNKKSREQFIERALREIKYWEERYETLNELTPIFVSIEKVSKKWQNKK